MRGKESDPEKREGEVAGVVRDNTFMAELESRIVPAIVERDTFWRRYFYRLHLLQEAHRARTQVSPPALPSPRLLHPAQSRRSECYCGLPHPFTFRLEVEMDASW